MKPLNRRETFLARMAGEDVTMPTPNTREEAWMKGLAEAINGNDDVKTPEPLTREEQYLKTVTEKIAVETKTLKEKTVTTNGVYKATDDDADGYSKVTVNVDIPVNPNNATFSATPAAFSIKKNLKSIDIPSEITSLDADAFNGCVKLESLVIPSGVTSIGNSAFLGCSHIENIDLPSTLTSIGNFVFQNCNGIRSLIVRAATPPTVGTGGIQTQTPNCTIYVPRASVDAYKAASGWSDKADYIQAIPE